MKSRGLRPWMVVVAALLWLLIIAGYLYYEDWLEHSQDVPILAAARHYQVDPALVKAIVWRETHFHPNRHGSHGEIGLMQIIPTAAAADWASAEHNTNFIAAQLEDPATNTMIGAWYIEKLLHRYEHTDNPLPYALADYNAGRGNVLKWMHGIAASNSAAFEKQIGFPSTRNYVRSIKRKYQDFKLEFSESENIKVNSASALPVK